MVVFVEAAGSLRALIPSDTCLVDVESIAEAMAQLPLPKDVGIAMLVNGRVAHWHSELRDGDVLTLLPVICGGAESADSRHRRPLSANLMTRI